MHIIDLLAWKLLVGYDFDKNRFFLAVNDVPFTQLVLKPNFEPDGP